MQKKTIRSREVSTENTLSLHQSTPIDTAYIKTLLTTNEVIKHQHPWKILSNKTKI